MEPTEDGVSRWRRVSDLLRAGIADGSLADRLPPEAELAERFAVNRHTVRRAIAVLARDGLLRAEQGRGTFVNAPAPRLPYPVGPRTRFSENVLAQSRQPGGRLIRADRVRADAGIARLLACDPGAPLHRLETLHVADGVPLSVATSWFSAARFPGIVQAYAESGSVTEALRREGLLDYRRRETRLTAERLSPGDADHLSASPDGLVLVSTAIDVDGEDRPVQALRTRFHADRMELVFRH
ncbi:phosphonate metabolism transcriptional regulator PhnF [Aureimonas sp. AU12]|uniref:phosphonate metabolism transcriptional regulator PhnF n=1 Tax=Aureimonas sp. AU12 TaxID=1638161 RepID=UPI0007819E61|nr:phosphonate metabolism transcriptional regulator PhnF [Aureimonas sp. AU12]